MESEPQVQGNTRNRFPKQSTDSVDTVVAQGQHYNLLRTQHLAGARFGNGTEAARSSRLASIVPTPIWDQVEDLKRSLSSSPCLSLPTRRSLSRPATGTTHHAPTHASAGPTYLCTYCPSAHAQNEHPHVHRTYTRPQLAHTPALATHAP